MALNALFYPKGTDEKPIDFDSLYIPYIYKEIYLEGIYVDIFNTQKDLVIMDVGANLGIVTQYMRKYAKQIYALEPSKDHFEALSKNIEFNKWDNVKAFNMAIADKDGEMTLNNNNSNRTCHSLTLNYNQGGEQVKTIRFDTFLKENNIEQVDFCKFDVEGAEDMILYHEGFISVAPKIKSIMIEFHHPTWQKLVEHLMRLGYEARRYNSSAIVVLFTRK
jgi:FkbM family methyltransferase